MGGSARIESGVEYSHPHSNEPESGRLDEDMAPCGSLDGDKHVRGVGERWW
jgi:hypothetical protein